MSANQEVVLVEVVLREEVLQAPYPECATPTLSIRIENQNHADRVPDSRPTIIINE